MKKVALNIRIQESTKFKLAMLASMNRRTLSDYISLRLDDLVEHDPITADAEFSSRYEKMMKEEKAKQ